MASRSPEDDSALALAAELERLVDSAGSKAAIATHAPTLTGLARRSGRSGRSLLLAGIELVKFSNGRTQDGKKYEFALSVVGSALEDLFADANADSSLTERREHVATTLGTGHNAVTGRRNTARLCAQLAAAILDVVSGRKPPTANLVAQVLKPSPEYVELRNVGRWQRTWTNVAQTNAEIARAALLHINHLAQSEGQLETGVRSPEPSAVDERVLLAASPLRLGDVEVEIMAEATGVHEFERATRLRELEELAPRAGTGLVLRFVPSPVCPPTPAHATFLEFARRFGLLVSPHEVDALVSGDIAVAELIAMKLYRGLAEGRPPRDFAVDVSRLRDIDGGHDTSLLRPAREVLAELPISDSPIAHPSRDVALAHLRARDDVLITGASSSGKSTLILQLAEALQDDAEVLYVDFGETPTVWPNTAQDILFGLSQETLILVDDLQSYPGGADLILGAAALRKESLAAQRAGLTIGAAAWREFGGHASSILPGIFTMTISPRQLSAPMTHRFGGGLSADDRRAIGERFGNDLHVLRLALQQARRLGADFLAEGSEEHLATAYLEHVYANVKLPPDRIERALVALAALGQFDIAAPRRFLARAAGLDVHDFDLLVSANFGRVQGNYMRLGHRSLCAILAREFERNGAWARFRGSSALDSPEEIVTEYLESLQGGEAIGALRAICARATFVDSAALDEVSQQIVHVWSCFNGLIERIRRQQAEDATWGGTPSSCMYAAQAFSAIGYSELADPSLSFLRDTWTAIGDELRVNLERLSTKDDFEKIGELMALLGDIDIDRFHATWVAGLCLTAETVGSEKDRLGSLLKSLWQWQLPEGGFYPLSVPWVTARVLMAMGAAGETVHTSSRTSRAVEWLLTPKMMGGPYADGVWEGGTGGWNSDLETTSMVLVALAAVGVDHDEPRVLPAVRFVQDQRSEWMRPGKELDGALAIRALLKNHVDWADVSTEATELASRALDDALWQSAVASASDTLAQSCRTAQITTDLLEIAWAGVRANMPALLGAITLGAEA